MTPILRAVLTAFALSAAAAAPSIAQTAPAETPAGEVQTLPDVVLGDESAPVTVIEYASFTCSHCANFHEESFPLLKSEYIDTGKVKFIQRDVYFDQVGLWAGVLAHCGDNAKYYPISGMLFDQQSEWLKAESGDQLAANLRKIGATAGFSNEQMDACWADQERVEQLVATFQQNAGGDDIQGTPTFIIGGEKVQNLPWPQLQAKIDEKLAAASPAAPAAN
ncbi:DsbA family protein [Paracoccus sp. Z118]|uniref:DsbA family protein n=1 Tax=Paracoccus sp. Z118 TaxID=2851017 RepID=UPI001C2C7B74|nr:DsbA family protein [Paracoccus sp. Z118]MBV0892449.1 DsbA family protein [Paracoccus sp. Z118]